MSQAIKKLINVNKIYLYLCVFILLSATMCTAASLQTIKNIQDANNLNIVITKPFTRIISLYSAHTENLFSLGAQDQLVGISRTDDFPESILTKPKFSYREDPEKFIALNPDLVLVRPMVERSYPQFIDKLRRAGITVISLQPNSVGEMFEYWRNLGILTGKEEEAEQMITDFNRRLSRVQKSLSSIPMQQRPHVYFESIHSKSKTFAPESIGIFVLKEAGGINIGSDATQVRKTNIAYYGKEQLLAKGSDIDIFLAQVGRMNPVSVETIINEPGYQAIKAVSQSRVYLIEEQLVSRPTLRITEGIERLHKLFFTPQTTTATQQ